MNSKIVGTNSAARLHHRWWFSLLPHHTDFTSDGYYNNWWEYYYTNTFVSYIVTNKSEYSYKINQKIERSAIHQGFPSNRRTVPCVVRYVLSKCDI